VALAGRLLNIPCVIVMPSDAPPVKRVATAEYGAEIVLYDRERENREAIGQRLAAERRLAVVPPFDHPHIVGGAGTAARELFEEVGPLDVLMTPCGGGGLLSGSSLAAQAQSPGCRIVGVEPVEGDDAKRSLETRELQTVHNPRTVADGARTSSLGTITFPMVLNHVSAIVTVDDATLLRTMFFLWERLKLVVEPTGALAAAALLNGRIDSRGRRVGVILSGGNVDFSQVEAWRGLV
jgi:threonine dehydratase